MAFQCIAVQNIGKIMKGKTVHVSFKPLRKTIVFKSGFTRMNLDYKQLVKVEIDQNVKLNETKQNIAKFATRFAAGTGHPLIAAAGALGSKYIPTEGKNDLTIRILYSKQDGTTDEVLLTRNVEFSNSYDEEQDFLGAEVRKFENRLNRIIYKNQGSGNHL